MDIVRYAPGRVGVLTLSRPPVNALDRTALDALDAGVAQFEADADARILLLTSGLPSVFCAGGDLTYWQDVLDADEVSRAGTAVFERIRRLIRPVVVAVNGPVIGDGLALVLAADVRLAALPATFALPEVRYGFIPGWGTITRLRAAVGPAWTADLLLTGRHISARRALQLGLVTAVVPSARLTTEARALAERLAGSPPRVMAAAKAVLNGRDEAASFREVWSREEWALGIRAFFGEQGVAGP